MPTHIDEATTEVVTESEPESANSGGDTRWKDADRIKKMIGRNECLRNRTKAEGFDD